MKTISSLLFLNLYCVHSIFRREVIGGIGNTHTHASNDEYTNTKSSSIPT